MYLAFSTDWTSPPFGMLSKAFFSDSIKTLGTGPHWAIVPAHSNNHSIPYLLFLTVIFLQIPVNELNLPSKSVLQLFNLSDLCIQPDITSRDQRSGESFQILVCFAQSWERLIRIWRCRKGEFREGEVLRKDVAYQAWICWRWPSRCLWRFSRVWGI